MNKYDNDSNRLLEELRAFPKHHQLTAHAKEQIHQRIMNAADEYEQTKKTKGAFMRVKSIVATVSAAALGIFIFSSTDELSRLSIDGPQTEKQSAGKPEQENIADADEKESEIKEKPIQEEPVETIDKALLKERLTGEVFLKTMVLDGNKLTAEYFGSFDELKQAHPETEFRESDYIGFFGSGDAIEKILTAKNLLLFIQFPALESISIILPFEGKTYSVHLNRQEAADFAGFDLDTLDPENNNWNTQFINPYFGNEGGKRDKFFDHFVKVEELSD